jgi:hypothetical protein
MKKLLLVLALILTTSCVTQKKRAKICATCPTHTIDSIYVEKHITDTIVKFEADSASMEALLACDSLGNVYIKELSQSQGNFLTLQAYLKNNKFIAKAKHDTIIKHVPGVKEVIYITKKTEVTKTVEKKGFLYYSGISAISILGLVLLFKIIGLVRKFKQPNNELVK